MEAGRREGARARRFLGRAIDPEVVDSFLKTGDPAADELQVLTPRQREILQLIAEGTSTRDIAERLHVSVKTVETHRAQLMSRLGIRDVPGLVRFADCQDLLVENVRISGANGDAIVSTTACTIRASEIDTPRRVLWREHGLRSNGRCLQIRKCAPRVEIARRKLVMSRRE